MGEMLPALVNIVKEKPLLRRSISPASSSLERAVSSVLTSNAGKEQRLPGSSACSRGHTHGKGDCRKCGFGGRGRTTIPGVFLCSFSAYLSRSYLSSIGCHGMVGKNVNLGINFGFFSPCAPHLRNGWYCGTGKSLRRVLCVFGRDIRSISVTGSYRTVHKIFRTNLLRISSNSDII